MRKMRCLLGLVMLFCFVSAEAQAISGEEAVAEWNALKKQPITEKQFKQVCDLIQDIAQSDINESYSIFTDYFPKLRATGNKQWIHVLLMNWAKAKESLGDFGAADSLYWSARENAVGNPQFTDEALVATVLMFLESGIADSVNKYMPLGLKSCMDHHDRENLSFIYTFRALSHMEDSASLRKFLDSAILLASDLTNKNAQFTARYNRAVFYSQFNLQQQVSELDNLLELSKDSSLSRKPRLYERTAFSFRSPIPSIYYQLMLVNLLLTDYSNAWKFAQLFYNAMLQPNPHSAQAPQFNAVMALVLAYMGNYESAKDYLRKSRDLFQLPENKISYPTYSLAAGMIAEHANNNQRALHYYEAAYRNGNMSYGLHLMPPAIYYAHGLIQNKNYDSAQKLLSDLRQILLTRTYSAIGFYYYKYEAELLKARGDYAAYDQALQTFYAIKDSLASIVKYKAVQEIETRMRVRENEHQIAMLNLENVARQKELRKDKINLTAFALLASTIILLLLAYGQNQKKRKQQAQQLANQSESLQAIRIAELEKQHRIEVMQGVMNAEERERHKIAAQLHDDAGSLLALASLNISSVMEKGKDDAQSDEKIRKAHEILTTVAGSIREISHQLTPMAIQKYGLRKAVEDLAYSINLSEKIKLETVIIGFEQEQQYSESLKNSIYRIIQELLQNMIKHAQASLGRLELIEHEQLISITLEDNGKGIDENRLPNGSGIASVQSKIAYLNGKIEFVKGKEKGTLVVIEIEV